MLFLLLLIVAVALGVIGALSRDTLYLLIIGGMVVIADLVLLRTRMGRNRRPRVLVRGAVRTGRPTCPSAWGTTASWRNARHRSHATCLSDVGHSPLA